MSDDASISYQQWGIDFFRAAISEERVLGAVTTITGQPIEIGPIGVGPGRIAKFRAHGKIGAATITQQPGDAIRYRVLLPVSLTIEVDLQVETHRFEAELLVPLTLVAHAQNGVRIFIEAIAPRAEEINVQLKAKGLRASVLQRLAGIEGEVRRFVAGYVRRELAKPHVQETRMIDVSRAIERAWESLAPAPRADGVTTDLNDELEREIEHYEESLAGDPEGR
jgi:hypothetical protein